MILLDTNYLIRALIDGTDEAAQVTEWLNEGEELCTSAISWYEFVSGPVDPEGMELIHRVIGGRVLPFVQDTAVEAARLFNLGGRVRRLRVDAMIAASAIIVNAYLATEKTADFRIFAKGGLRVI